MTDGGIGRILVASLHQGISDALPMRLEYYEHWLSPRGLREGRTGLAPFGAVLSFLRQEGLPAYDDVMRRAGRCAAEWHHAEHRFAARAARLLPRRARARFAVRQARGLIRAAFAPARSRARVRGGNGTMSISESVFCGLRESWPWPTCGYFAAATERQLELLGLSATVAIEQCRATGAETCRLRVETSADGWREVEAP